MLAILWSGLSALAEVAEILSSVFSHVKCEPLRKHGYSNILRILPHKNENFQMKR